MVNTVNLHAPSGGTFIAKGKDGTLRIIPQIRLQHLHFLSPHTAVMQKQARILQHARIQCPVPFALH